MSLDARDGDPGGTRTPYLQIRNLSLYPDELRDHKSVMPEFIMECQPAKATFFPAFFGPSLYLISVRNFPLIDKLNARAHKSAKDVAR